MRFFVGIGSKAKRFFFSSPATKEKKAVNGENPVGGFDFKSRPVVGPGIGYSDFGSTEEIFFDSKAWMDSDCEDEFYSVNGDSRGSTPNHQFTPARSQLKESLLYPSTPSPEAKSEPSPTDGKKKLFDLLQESNHGGRADDERKNTETYTQPPRSSQGSPYLWSGEMTPSRDGKHKKDRAGRGSNCCFPGLTPNRNFRNDSRKSSKASPVH